MQGLDGVVWMRIVHLFDVRFIDVYLYSDHRDCFSSALVLSATECAPRSLATEYPFLSSEWVVGIYCVVSLYVDPLYLSISVSSSAFNVVL